MRLVLQLRLLLKPPIVERGDSGADDDEDERQQPKRKHKSATRNAH